MDLRRTLGHSADDLTEYYTQQVNLFRRQVQLEGWHKGQFQLAGSLDHCGHECSELACGSIPLPALLPDADLSTGPARIAKQFGNQLMIPVKVFTISVDELMALILAAITESKTVDKENELAESRALSLVSAAKYARTRKAPVLAAALSGATCSTRRSQLEGYRQRRGAVGASR